MPRHRHRNRRPRSVGDCFVHTRSRAAMRFNAQLTREQYDALITHIRSGRGLMLWAESNTRTHWLIRLNGQLGSAVYNNETGAVSTLLDQGQVEQNLLAYGRKLAQYPLSRAFEIKEIVCSHSSSASSATATTHGAATVVPTLDASWLPGWASLN